MKDLGASLDWVLETSLKNNSKLVHTKFGPLFCSVDITHPDTARVCLATGMNKWVVVFCVAFCIEYLDKLEVCPYCRDLNLL